MTDYHEDDHPLITIFLALFCAVMFLLLVVMSNNQSSRINEKLYKEAGIDYRAIKEKREKRWEIRRKIRNSNRRHHEMDSRLFQRPC